MAVIPSNAYPTKTTAPSASYPYGGAQNVTSPGDGTGTPWIANLINDIFGFQQALLTEASIVPSGSPDTATASQYLQALQAIFALKTEVVATPSGVRQTVQSGSVDTSGFANFVSIGTGLNVNIAATTTPIVVHMAGGAISNDVLVTISADTSLLLGASVTSYMYLNDSGTLGSTTLAPIYQFGGTPAVTNGQFTYNISEGKAYFGNGTTAPNVLMTFFGEAITNGTNVTSVVTYALNGIAVLTQATISAAVYSLNHNIGTNLVSIDDYIYNKTAELNYSIGDRVRLNAVVNPTTTATLGGICSLSGNAFRINLSYGSTYILNKTTTTPAAITFANWGFQAIIKRSW